MWTGASTRALLEYYTANNEPERIRMFQTNFVGMLLPKDQLRTELFHVGMKNGRMLVKGMTSKVNGDPVLKCIAEVEQPATAYVFTGQGSQEVGMGMDLYSQSAAARSVWDRAERHMVDKYGVSLLAIVRTNPKELTVHFGGLKGERVQRNYMLLSTGNGKVDNAFQLFPDITSDSLSYTYRSPMGLLNATQFTQVALVAYAMAAVADMRSKSLVQTSASFAGHSLGEYAALVSLSGLFTLEDVLDITFYRGMLMQLAVRRDSQGRSQYGMVAVDPSRTGKTVSENVLALVIEAIRIHGQELLEVVNFNVHGLQYVVGGTLRQLSALRLVLDSIAKQGAPAEDELPEHIANVVSSVFAQPIHSKPVRGRATIPLSGIDVPFHSSQLLPGVDEFRALLQAKILPERVNYSALRDRYIPNLTAAPFEVSKQYFELVHGMTGSPVAASVLDSWSDAALERADEVTKLAAALLVELLAYQFASPVQWIDTQDVLLNKLGVHRLVEIGVSPVLSGMAAKTLKSAAHAGKRVEVLHNERDKDTIYYTQQIRDAAESTIAPQASSLLPAQPEQTTLPVVAPVATVVAESTTPTVLAPISSSSSAPLVDVPLQALDVIHAVVAHKTKRSLADVSVQKSIKSMVGGKSTLQNEIVGDLHKELGSKIPDKAEDLSLQDLAAAVGALTGGLGKYSQAQLARLFSNKMPGGFSLSTARSTLQSAYGVGVQRQDALLLVALTMEPADRLTSDAEAKAWLDTAAQAYAAKAGISYSAAAGSGSGGSGGQAGAPVVSSAEMEKMQLKQHEHIRQQIQVLARYAGIDLREGARLAEGEQARAADLQTKIDSITAELGDELIDGVQPMFDTRKARHYDSCWNWARQEAYEVIQQAIISCAPGSHEAPPASIDAASLQRLQNRSCPGLLQMISGMLSVLQAANSPSLGPAVQLVSQMHDACSKSLAQSPVYRELSAPTGPLIKIDYIVNGANPDILLPKDIVVVSESPRTGEPSFVEFVEHMRQPVAPNTPPHLHLKKQAADNTWAYCTDLSATYFSALSDICGGGLSFAGKTALVTGCGNGSIGADIVSSLLSGGAKVVATT
ncbi:fatty acid synthase alpha subunit Lsd1, partial [Coemansia thaxteri]